MEKALIAKASECCSKSLWNEAPCSEGRLATKAAMLEGSTYYIEIYASVTLSKPTQ